jgi:hypothetical protein
MDDPRVWVVLALGGLLVWWLLGVDMRHTVSLDPDGVDIRRPTGQPRPVVPADPTTDELAAGPVVVVPR